MLNITNLVDSDILDKIKEIEKNYDLIKYQYIKPNDKKIILGNKENRICRFCGRDKTSVTFKKRAHAVPELLGNKTLFSYYECDECNQKFSELLENNLSAYLSYYRTLVRMRGKRGNLKFKQHDINMYDKGDMFYIEAKEGSEKINLDEHNKNLSIKINRDPYVPIGVYKCFVKIALTLLDEKDLDKVKWAIEWIGEENHSNSRFNMKPLILYKVFTPGNSPYEGIMIQIFRRKKKFEYKIPYKCKVQYIMCVVRFENFVFQVHIPSIDDFNQGKMEVKTIVYPGRERNYIYGESQYSAKDMSKKETVVGEPLEINLKFEGIEDVTETMRLNWRETKD